MENVYRRVNYDLKSGEPGYWKRQRDWKDYDQTATLIALSQYHAADEVCECGFNGLSCGDRLVCLRCCYNLLAEPALLEFGRSFDADQECYYMVLSLSRERDEKKRFIFKDLTKSEMQQVKLSGQFEQGQLNNYGVPFSEPLDALEIQTYFEIYRQVISDFTGTKRGQIFSGAFGGPELSVRFLPLAALPHANYLAWTPGISEDDLRRLRHALRNKMRGSRRLRSGLYPKLAVYRILAKKDFRAVIRYIFKPIDFGLAYHMAAESVDCAPADLRRLNAQLDYFFDNLPEAMCGVCRMNRYGFCSPASSVYVGHVTVERKLRRKKDTVRRQKRRKQEAEMRRKFPDFKPYKRHKSWQERQDELRMRILFKQFADEGKWPSNTPKRFLRRTRLSPQSGRRKRAQPGGPKSAAGRIPVESCRKRELVECVTQRNRRENCPAVTKISVLPRYEK